MMFVIGNTPLGRAVRRRETRKDLRRLIEQAVGMPIRRGWMWGARGEAAHYGWATCDRRERYLGRTLAEIAADLGIDAS